MAKRQIGLMTRLLDDLLPTPRASSTAKSTCARSASTCRTVIRNAIETARPGIEARKHSFTSTLPEGPVWVNGDATRLSQLVANLLNNAAKYTDEAGRIELSLSLQANSAVISVRDNGVGIEKEKQPLVFDMFTQVDNSMQRMRRAGLWHRAARSSSASPNCA